MGLEIGFEVDGAEELAKLGVTEGAAVVELEDEDKVIGVCDGIEVGVNKGVDKGKAEVNFAVGVADKNTVGVLEGDLETLGEVVGAIGRFVVGEVVGENVVGFLEGDLEILGGVVGGVDRFIVGEVVGENVVGFLGGAVRGDFEAMGEVVRTQVGRFVVGKW